MRGQEKNLPLYTLFDALQNMSRWPSGLRRVTRNHLGQPAQVRILSSTNVLQIFPKFLSQISLNFSNLKAVHVLMSHDAVAAKEVGAVLAVGDGRSFLGLAARTRRTSQSRRD